MFFLFIKKNSNLQGSWKIIPRILIFPYQFHQYSIFRHIYFIIVFLNVNFSPEVFGDTL